MGDVTVAVPGTADVAGVTVVVPGTAVGVVVVVVVDFTAVELLSGGAAGGIVELPGFVGVIAGVVGTVPGSGGAAGAIVDVPGLVGVIGETVGNVPGKGGAAGAMVEEPGYAGVVGETTVVVLGVIVEVGCVVVVVMGTCVWVDVAGPGIGICADKLWQTTKEQRKDERAATEFFFILSP